MKKMTSATSSSQPRRRLSLDEEQESLIRREFGVGVGVGVHAAATDGADDILNVAPSPPPRQGQGQGPWGWTRPSKWWRDLTFLALLSVLAVAYVTNDAMTGSITLGGARATTAAAADCRLSPPPSPPPHAAAADAGNPPPPRVEGEKEGSASIHELSVTDGSTSEESAAFDTAWPQLREALCPSMKPKVELGGVLFAEARREFGMVPYVAKWEKPFTDANGALVWFHPKTNQTIIYMRIFKAANNQITGWANGVYGGYLMKRGWEQRRLEGNNITNLIAKLKEYKENSRSICIVTAVRDPIKRFLSGYNEVEHRLRQDPSRIPNPPPLLYTRFQNGTVQRFRQFVADYVSIAQPGREMLEYHRQLEFSHIFSSVGLLDLLARANTTLTDYAPGLENITEEFPKFVHGTCLPRGALSRDERDAFPVDPMPPSGKHQSSTDPHGFYRAAKEVWNGGGDAARALCALHAADYACWDRLPNGVPDLCKRVYGSSGFLGRVLRRRLNNAADGVRR